MTEDEFKAAQEAMAGPLEELSDKGVGYFIWVIAPIGDELATSTRSNVGQELWDEVKGILVKEILERKQEPITVDDLRAMLEAALGPKAP